MLLAAGAALSLVTPLAAQTTSESCTQLVTNAMTAVSENCAGLGRNQACYGHSLVSVSSWDPGAALTFEAAGDTADVAAIQTLTTSPLDPAADIWGIAVLALQADLPDTLPGQNVTFLVFGDAALSGQVPPDTGLAPSPTCEGTAAGGVNLRTGPSTNDSIVGSLAAGETVTITGRSAAGDWYSIDHESGTVWVYASLLITECDSEALLVVEDQVPTEAHYPGPMQAFYLTTGLGEPACQAAPRDGLLVQAPPDTTVHFLINGVEVSVGSTALLYTTEDVLSVNTLDGAVAVTAAGATETALPGQRVDAATGIPPTAPVAYDPADVQQAPVALLPEPVQVPPPAGEQVSIYRCTAVDGGQHAMQGGQPLVVNFSWAATELSYLEDYLDAATLTATFDGAPVPLWNISGPEEVEWGLAARHYWVIADPAPGQHRIEVTQTFARAFQDGGDYDNDGQLDVFGPGSETFTCLLTVQ